METQTFSALTLHKQLVDSISNQTILVTGGTGSFGQKFIATVFEHFQPKGIIVFSRDEFKQHHMKTVGGFSEQKYPNLHYVLGDIRNRDRLYEVLKEYRVDIVVHTAAIKHVDISEKNPSECIETNIIGSMNLVRACKDANVKKVLALSTDKCVDPINIYGASKLCLERIVITGNNFPLLKEFYEDPTQECPTIFSVARYGNVLGSRGSVVHVFSEQIKAGTLKVTDDKMTRFTLLKSEAVNFALNCMRMMVGGEVFIPELPSYSLNQLIRVMVPHPNFPIENIGLRPGEKIHESMISKHESHLALRINPIVDTNLGFYVIRNHFYGKYVDYESLYSKIFLNTDVKNCCANWSYSSDTNNILLEDDKLKALIALVLWE
jgi:UDP-N-acetylglucosamine 4,6-dehydratase